MNSINYNCTSVKVWEEEVIIPTYPVGEPEKYPMFPEKRVYQGSSGIVYPYPVIEKIYDERIEKKWTGLFLENDFLKIMIMPELGGRVQMAYDKMKGRHFVYYNQVIKPALVGLTGPWISGGIEFNWPQHHRPTTFDPVEYDFTENEDGSGTVWVNEIELMGGTKGKAGFTLHPDKAYLQIDVSLYNRTPFPQTFLWWANPAVKVNEAYQSVFPPDVHAVFDHGKRDVSAFPVAKGTYYKVDYSEGVDISRYKNIPVPTSYMAAKSVYDFVGGFENDSRAGLLHVASHYISPGKKQWTWGNGEFGQAWDRNLTDEDGPYIELMCGVYTDNQPDFSWLDPYEEKQFTQYFMPYQELGVVKNANQNVLVNLDIQEDNAVVKVYTTGFYPKTLVRLKCKDQLVWQSKVNFKPGTVFNQSIKLNKDYKHNELELQIISSDQKTLITWKKNDAEGILPESAQAALPPVEIESNELLYLNGLHLEQYRHATYNPLDYYREALKRDPEDIRNNTALGIWFLKGYQLKEAEECFGRAIKRLTTRNPNPYDGEAYYYLGVTYFMRGDFSHAYDAFYKSCWNAQWQNAGYFYLSRIDAINEDWTSALYHIEKSLEKNSSHHQALHLKSICHRKLKNVNEAKKIAEASFRKDQFNFGSLFELYILTGETDFLEKLLRLMRNRSFNFMEIAFDYIHSGCFMEALQLIGYYDASRDRPNPMILYQKAWLTRRTNEKEAENAYKVALQQPADFGFPNKWEEVMVLLEAISLNPSDHLAHHLLGNFFYARRLAHLAQDYWEKAVAINSTFSISNRNLALVYFNKSNNVEKAVSHLEKAFELDANSSRLLMELDQLYRRLNKPLLERKTLLEGHFDLVEDRDDLYLEYVALCNQLGQYELALKYLMDRKFHPWEGGEGKVTGQYVFSHIAMANRYICNGDFHKALDHLESARRYPENLGEGKLLGLLENDIHYWKGWALNGWGKNTEAAKEWELALKGSSEPEPAIYYNDMQPDQVFYKGLAFKKLGQTREATEIFQKLIDVAEDRIGQSIKIDYFAVSLPDMLLWEDDPQLRNDLFCYYMMGLGQIGMGNNKNALEALGRARKIDNSHQGVIWHYDLCKTGANF